jgi:hypothetical protein
MLQRMLDATPAPFANWAKVTLPPKKHQASPRRRFRRAIHGRRLARMAWIGRVAGRYQR